MLGYKKGNKKLLTGQIPLHYPGDRVYLDGDTTKTVQDKVARKSDLTNLDLTGTTNTTGSTIASGTYFYLNGTLVRAKTAIASGATFTENTNYETVPTGILNEIIERGSNTNGEYIKFADGTMICTKIKLLSSATITAQWGALYESAVISLGDYAQPFIATPVVTVANHGPAAGWAEYLLNTNATSFGDIRIVTATAVSAGNYNIHCVAIGKWR